MARAGDERRELSLGPEQFQIGEQGEVIVNSKELERALEFADVKAGDDESLASGEVYVGVVVGRSF